MLRLYNYQKKTIFAVTFAFQEIETSNYMIRNAILLIVIFICNVATINRVEAQRLKIKNETEFNFDRVIIYTERTEGRHIPPHDRIWGIKFDTPNITTDTVAYSKKIKLPGHGVYTLKFEKSGYVSCMCYGIDASKVKTLTLNRDNCTFLYCDEDNMAKFADGTLIKEPDLNYVEIYDIDMCCDLYFKFENKTPYTIYAINPKFSDGRRVKESLFLSNPDLRFLPNENRMITVAHAFTEDRYKSNPKLTLYFVGVDKNSKQVLFKHEVESLGADDITLDENSIEILDKHW